MHVTSIIPADQLRTAALHRMPTAHGLSDVTRGGQHCGVSHAVAVEHEPTGIVVIIGCQRSQHLNRNMAVQAIEFILTHPEFKG